MASNNNDISGIDISGIDISGIDSGFYYVDGNNLGVEVGDIVIVKLRGRLLNGLVISKEDFSKINKDEANTNEVRNIKYFFIEFFIIHFSDFWI